MCTFFARDLISALLSTENDGINGYDFYEQFLKWLCNFYGKNQCKNQNPSLEFSLSKRENSKKTENLDRNRCLRGKSLHNVLNLNWNYTKILFLIEKRHISISVGSSIKLLDARSILLPRYSIFNAWCARCNARKSNTQWYSCSRLLWHWCSNSPDAFKIDDRSNLVFWTWWKIAVLSFLFLQRRALWQCNENFPRFQNL